MDLKSKSQLLKFIYDKVLFFFNLKTFSATRPRNFFTVRASRMRLLQAPGFLLGAYTAWANSFLRGKKRLSFERETPADGIVTG